MQLLTAAELQDVFQFSRATMYRLLAEGMPSIGKGRLRRFNFDAVLEWMTPETQGDKKSSG